MHRKYKKTKHSKKAIKKSIYFEPSNISDIDLALAVGHADNCTVIVKKTSKFKNGERLYRVKIILKDLYDFSPPDNDDSWWVSELKKFGVSSQNSGNVTPYWWQFRFTYSVYKKD